MNAHRAAKAAPCPLPGVFRETGMAAWWSEQYVGHAKVLPLDFEYLQLGVLPVILFGLTGCVVQEARHEGREMPRLTWRYETARPIAPKTAVAAMRPRTRSLYLE